MINPEYVPQNKYCSSDDIFITIIGSLYSEIIQFET